MHLVFWYQKKKKKKSGSDKNAYVKTQVIFVADNLVGKSVTGSSQETVLMKHRHRRCDFNTTTLQDAKN